MTVPKTVLLCDGDVLAFIASAAVQHVLIGDDGWAQPFANTTEAEAVIENLIWSLKTGLKGDECRFYLSDRKENWRRLVDPTYKTHRVKDTRPMLLDHLKDYLVREHGAEFWPGLEADDTLSLLMTYPAFDTGVPYNEDFHENRFICVGRDKDFKSIPGLHHSIKQDVDRFGNMVVREVSPWEADRFHLIQTLAGDPTDGFYGCPGIGMERAAKIIDEPVRLVPQEGVKTRGINKGESVIRWMSEPTKDLWACIVSHYRKQGMGEPEALVTARLARLLRHGEYDRATEEVTLWTPELIKKRT